MDMLFKFTIMNLISIDLSSDFRGLSLKCTCMNHVSCNFHATHPHMIYVIHSMSICDHCLGLATLNVIEKFLWSVAGGMMDKIDENICE